MMFQFLGLEMQTSVLKMKNSNYNEKCHRHFEPKINGYKKIKRIVKKNYYQRVSGLFGR